MSEAEAPSTAEPRRCAFTIPMKHRTCNLPARPGSQYCATHDPDAADRVPCPKDPRHTVRTKDLARHLRRCKGQGLDRVCSEPYYSRGANLAPETGVAAAPEAEPEAEKEEGTATTAEGTPVKPLWQHPERVAEVVARLRALAAAPETRGFMTDAPELRMLEYDKAAEVEREMFRSSASAKHGPQVSSIVENMAREGFLSVSPESPVAFVEFGAGKAHLAKVVAAAVMLPTGTPMPKNDFQQKQQQRGQEQGEEKKQETEKEEEEKEEEEEGKVPFVLVDRAKFSASTERSCWGQVLSRGVAFSRVQIDITDLVLARVPALAPARGVRRVVAFGKHLCGLGCDTALRCVVRARAAMPAGTQFALAIALCCLHRCTWATYSSPAFIAAHGFSPAQFALLTSIAAWATSGPDKQQQEEEDEKEKEEEEKSQEPAAKCARSSSEEDEERTGRNPYGFAERRELGLLARRLLTEGRLAYLRSNGFPGARVVRYVDEAVSPENVLLLAHTDPWV